MVPCPQLIPQRKDLEQIISIDLISAIHGLRPLDLSFKIKIIEKTKYNCNMYKYAYVDSLLFHLPTSCPYFHISFLQVLHLLLVCTLDFIASL